MLGPAAMERGRRVRVEGGDVAEQMTAVRAGALAGRLCVEEIPVPEPGQGEILIRVSACGVCRTDLHIVDGELAPHHSRVVPGHEIVGRVAARGAAARRFALGQRVGVPWLGAACATCPHIIAPLAVRMGRTVFAFTRPGDRHNNSPYRSVLPGPGAAMTGRLNYWIRRSFSHLPATSCPGPWHAAGKALRWCALEST
jgi:hypothetical protein